MAIEIAYQVSNQEISNCYFYMLRNSSKFRTKISIGFFIILFLPIIMSVITKSDIGFSLILGLVLASGFVFLLPWISKFIRTKGNTTVILSENGINISVGKKTKNIAWKDISQIESIENFILLIHKSGNLVCIPVAAFPNSDSKSKFYEFAERHLVD